MADPNSPRSVDPRASQSTRQLLDDLDALMQRMLALPVENGQSDSDLAEETPVQPAPTVQSPQPRSVNLQPVPTSDVTISTPGSAAETKSTVTRKDKAGRRNKPVRAAEPAAAPATADRASTGAKDAEAPTAPLYIPASAEPIVPILLQRPKKPVQRQGPRLLPPNMTDRPPSAPEPLPAPRPTWMQAPAAAPPVQAGGLVLTINNIFDMVTKILGPLGAWLRGEQGRSLLGWSGIAMLTVAVIWALLVFLR